MDRRTRGQAFGPHGILMALVAVVILILAVAAVGIIAYVMLDSGDNTQPLVETKPTIKTTTRITTTRATTRPTTKATTQTLMQASTTTEASEPAELTTTNPAGTTTTTSAVTTTTTRRTTTTIEEGEPDTGLAECLGRKGVLLFTSSDPGCGECMEIKETLGDLSLLDTIYCNEEEDRPFCEDYNIDVYPTWQYEGETCEGCTVDEMQDIAGC